MSIIINQILIMGILIIVGYFLYKSNMIDAETSMKISNFLLKIIIPVTIIESFMVPFNVELLKQIGLVSVLTLVITFLMAYITKFIFKEDERIERYACIFTNKGFIGIPLMRAIFGIEAVSIVTPIIVISNIIAWTYGVDLLSGNKKKTNIRRIFTNPSVIGFIVGLIFFFVPFNFPYPITQSITLMESINTPLAMIVIGTYLAEENIALVLTNKKAYKVSFIRLILLPLIVIGLVGYLPIDPLVKNVFIISMAVPTAANTAMFAQLAGSNYSYGAQLVCLTTLLSGLTLPMIMLIIEYLF